VGCREGARTSAAVKWRRNWGPHVPAGVETGELIKRKKGNGEKGVIIKPWGEKG